MRALRFAPLPSLLPLALVCLAGRPAAGASSVHGYWLQAVPGSVEEAELSEIIAGTTFGDAAAQAEALGRLAAAHPGTTVSGLAQIAAGLALQDVGKNAEAVPHLTHADVQKTALRDHALLALSRALEAKAPEKAAESCLAAADADPTGPTACLALFRAAELYAKLDQPAKALPALERALSGCPGQEPRALLLQAEAQEGRGDAQAAVAAYERLDREYPASPEAREAGPRRRALGGRLPPESSVERLAREIQRGEALLDAGQNATAASVFAAALAGKPTGDELDRLRVRLARALLATGRPREAEAQLNAVGSGSAHAAEAAFLLARQRARRGAVEPYETVASRFPGTRWSEEALLQLANNYQKDALDEQAVPFYRRLLKEAPDGRYTERAAWRVAWLDYREGRYEDAATLLETTARGREPGASTPGFLYWAGRARAAQGQTEKARALFDETVRRFKHSYHGLRARESLAQLPPRPPAPDPSPVEVAPSPRGEVPEPQRSHLLQLLLIDRLEEAADELRGLPSSPVAQATIAWIEWRRGRLRPAIVAMKKAYPEWISEAGDFLPADVWRILYPIGFEETLAKKAAEESLDPALVASLVCQESTFDPGAVSRAGARGLMQVVPLTGFKLARELGVKYRRAALHDPATSLDFGTRYLRDMLDRFGGREERALAAYNAGPHRVDAWTATRPDMSAEEFVESIPFTETRFYVMTVLANREQYRRLYAFARTSGGSGDSGSPP